MRDIGSTVEERRFSAALEMPLIYAALKAPLFHEARHCKFAVSIEREKLMPDTILVIVEQREAKLNRVQMEGD